MHIKTLDTIGDVAGKYVLVRLDLNVPVENGAVVDDFRIRKALPTLRFLQERNAKVLAVSHIEDGGSTLEPVAHYLRDALRDFSFSKHLFGAMAQNMRATLRDGEVLLYENIREHEGEKNNDPAFAQQLADLADIYINDAFGVSHREHASVVGIPPLLPSFAGLQLVEELQHLSQAFNPPRPFVFILGGAKFDTKLPLLEKFLGIADRVFVGGAIANVLLDARGYPIGDSLSVKDDFGQKRIAGMDNLVLPLDMVVKDVDGVRAIKTSRDIGAGESIMDVGSKTIETLRTAIRDARFVLWNGPLGFYEGGYTQGTEMLATAIAESGAKTVVGGGDTLAAIKKLDIEDRFSFVSTGGGAMLDFLAAGSLPGIRALE